MAYHEDKYCPRCQKLFECKVGNILQCQCHGFNFTDNERDYIRSHYTDCLCRDCLTVMKHELHTLAVQQKLKSILSSKN